MPAAIRYTVASVHKRSVKNLMVILFLYSFIHIIRLNHKSDIEMRMTMIYKNNKDNIDNSSNITISKKILQY